MPESDKLPGRRYASDRVRRIVEAYENENPALAAERAAERFERASIALPAVLVANEDDPPWKQRVVNDAAYMFQTITMAGDAGVKLRDLDGGERVREALKFLRRSGTIRETRERLLDRAGHEREMVVLHVREEP